MRKLPLLILLLAGSASAHDLWVQPAAFWVPGPSSVAVSIQVGHGKDRENWGIRSDRILEFRSIGPNGQVTDFLPVIRKGSTAPTIALPFRQAGTHLIAMKSNHAESDLPAAQFNEFLKEEGLTPAIAHRQRTGASGRPGREIYSRRAKALVQVGRVIPGARSPATRRLGMTLEIVPERDPYMLRPGEKLPLLIYYQGRPLAGALVKLTNLEQDSKPAALQRSDRAGRASFNVPRQGKWQLNVVWTRPIAGNSKADFETTFSSLSFGYPSARASRTPPGGAG